VPIDKMPLDAFCMPTLALTHFRLTNGWPTFFHLAAISCIASPRLAVFISASLYSLRRRNTCSPCHLIRACAVNQSSHRISASCSGRSGVGDGGRRERGRCADGGGGLGCRAAQEVSSGRRARQGWQAVSKNPYRPWTRPPLASAVVGSDAEADTPRMRAQLPELHVLHRLDGAGQGMGQAR